MAESNFSKGADFLARISGIPIKEARKLGRENLEMMIPSVVTESTGSAAAFETVERISKGAAPDANDQFNLEAIIIPERRPAVLVQNGNFKLSHPDWKHLDKGEGKKKIRASLSSIGRIELPNHPNLPYGGTGFVVGDGILMTNRHVAEIFADGLGVKGLMFRAGQGADIDFLQEQGNTESSLLHITKILMIHPYWDMALIRVEGLSDKHRPLQLSLVHPDGLLGKDVAVVGYPAFDPRNNADVQNKVFGGVFNVKRLQPGKIGAGKGDARADFGSFGKMVSALMHDASTLGGNSGSALIDPDTGDVFGLHFAGAYLDANYAVPAFELARDARIVDVGVKFSGVPSPDKGIHAREWVRADSRVEGALPDVPAQSNAGKVDNPSRPPTKNGSGEVKISLQLEIKAHVGDAGFTVHVGEAALSQNAANVTLAAAPASAELPAARTVSDVARGPLTFRDPAISMLQSVAAAVARKQGRSPATESVGGTEGVAGADIILATEAVARAAIANKTYAPARSAATEFGAREELAGVTYAGYCASITLDLIRAKMAGDTAAVREILDHRDFGQCDPAWASTVKEYLSAYGLSGDPSQRVYVNPAVAGPQAIPIKPGARVGIIGDWGTGARPARKVLEQLKEQKPDLIVHLGDIYYSGTDEECRENFETVLNEVLDRKKSKIPVFNLCGNHDMYCGGGAYFSMLKRLNTGAQAQKASFFCLRATDNSWQLLGFDTGRNDYKVHSVADVVTFVEEQEADWLLERVREFAGRTVLLSHHPLFSAFSAIGVPDTEGLRNPCNLRLQSLYKKLLSTGRNIPAWFWGHEHNLGIYAPFEGLKYGRCVGHSAIPVPEAENAYAVLPGLSTTPTILPNTMLAIQDGYYCNGFAILTLGASTLNAEYFQNYKGKANMMFKETIS